VTPQALILTYHGVESAEGPIFVEPALFASHLDCIVESGARVLTVSELGHALQHGTLDGRNVAITFDDGMESVTRVAAPLLAERALRATVFCVAGHVGGESNWPSARPGAPTVALSSAEALAGLVAAGWEIGCHGMTHAPLDTRDRRLLDCEIVESKEALENRLGAEVDSFALPYGTAPSADGLELLRRNYGAVCTTRPGSVGAGDDPYSLPRVDAHYVCSPRRFPRALAGRAESYLFVRGVAARARRVVLKDYSSHPIRGSRQ
jgi:peptidoglycan/xylan/chitin deacetylase (PgdA/CDA1 family)